MLEAWLGGGTRIKLTRAGVKWHLFSTIILMLMSNTVCHFIFARLIFRNLQLIRTWIKISCALKFRESLAYSNQSLHKEHPQNSTFCLINAFVGVPLVRHVNGTGNLLNMFPMASFGSVITHYSLCTNMSVVSCLKLVWCSRVSFTVRFLSTLFHFDMIRPNIGDKNA